MPRELARVMASYTVMQKDAAPLLNELSSHGRDYATMRERVSLLVEQLADELKDLNAKSATDPRAAQSPAVQSTLEDIEKNTALRDDRRKEYAATVNKVIALHAEVVKLQKDVIAVVKAKSGFFATSKSRPQLNALSTALAQFAAEMQTVVILGK